MAGFCFHIRYSFWRSYWPAYPLGFAKASIGEIFVKLLALKEGKKGEWCNCHRKAGEAGNGAFAEGSANTAQLCVKITNGGAGAI